MSEVSAFIALPTGGSFIARALGGLAQPSRRRGRYKIAPTDGEANSINLLWAQALNERPWRYFAMHHSDVIAPAYWLDTCVDELEAHVADVLSVAIPIKDDRGLTSTCVRSLYTRNMRRITQAELQRLPETFGVQDVPWTSDQEPSALLVNNGLWVCRFDADWVEEVTFNFYCRNFHDGERWVAGMYSEDWAFSEWCHTRGLKVMATRKVVVTHQGRTDYRSDEVWGDKVDKSWLAPAVTTIAVGDPQEV